MPSFGRALCYLNLFEAYITEVNMQSQLTITQDGTMYADFCMDDAPSGFEDCFHTSMFYHRLMMGTAFAELGEPCTDHLLGDPVANLRRIVCIEEKSICAHITMQQLDAAGNYLRAILKPYGPRADALRGLWLTNPTGLMAKFRYTESNDDDGDLTVKNICGLDVIQL